MFINRLNPTVFDELNSRPQPCNSSHVLGSAFHAVRHGWRLVERNRICSGSALNDRVQFGTVRRNQHAGAHGAVEPFMSRNTEVIKFAVRHINWQDAGRLRTVDRNRYAVNMAQSGNALYRQPDSPHIGGMRADNQFCVFP